MGTHVDDASRSAHRDDAAVAFAGVAGLARLIDMRQVSPRDAVNTYLDRIARLDPQLNAFKMVFAERALKDAHAAERRLLAGESAPLLGVPIAVKDQCDVAGEVTAYGTAAFDQPAAADCEVVRRLRAAGTIVIGKTTCASWDCGPSPRASRGASLEIRGT